MTTGLCASKRAHRRLEYKLLFFRKFESFSVWQLRIPKQMFCASVCLCVSIFDVKPAKVVSTGKKGNYSFFCFYWSTSVRTNVVLLCKKNFISVLRKTKIDYITNRRRGTHSFHHKHNIYCTTTIILLLSLSLLSYITHRRVFSFTIYAYYSSLYIGYNIIVALATYKNSRGRCCSCGTCRHTGCDILRVRVWYYYYFSPRAPEASVGVTGIYIYINNILCLCTCVSVSVAMLYIYTRRRAVANLTNGPRPREWRARVKTVYAPFFFFYYFPPKMSPPCSIFLSHLSSTSCGSSSSGSTAAPTAPVRSDGLCAPRPKTQLVNWQPK